MTRSLSILSWVWVLLSIPVPLAFSASDIGSLDSDIPVVLTPTRLRQSLADVPASVTVITSEMLKRYGITSVPEALRLVPGMAVTQVTGNDYRVQYHGTNILVPRRMNVLIDGMSAYRPALARVDWNKLPVALEDIEWIEVTRGPNSASYGANSMLAVVNIITKHPAQVEGTALALTAGTRETVGATVRYGGRLGEATAYRLTVDHQRDAGYDFASALGQGHDSTRVNRLTFRSVTDVAADETLDVQGTVLTGRLQNEFIDRFQQGNPDIRSNDYYINASWRRTMSPNHEVQVRLSAMDGKNDQSWTDCLPTIMLLPQLSELWRANPQYVKSLLAGRAPSGGSPGDDALAAAVVAAYNSLGSRAAVPTCADANQDYREGRYDFELQDTSVFGNNVRAVSGFGLRRDFAYSQTFAGGSVTNDSGRVFSNVEYAPIDPVRINIGGYFEHDGLTGSAFSPRLGINARISKNHTVRAVASQAVRMPGLWEQRANWRYRATNFRPPLNGTTDGYFYASARAGGNLKPERIRSRELGYFGNFPQYGLLVDAKLFDDRLRDLISEKTQVFDFSPTNRNSARLRGAELQFTYEPDEVTALYLAYSYLHNEATTVLEQTQYASHSGALGLSRAFAGKWRASLALYYYGAHTQGQTPYSRQDISLSNAHRLSGGQTLTGSFTIQHLSNRSTGYFIDFGQTEESRYDDPMRYLFTVRLTY